MYIISNRFKNTIYLCWLKVRRSLHKKKPYSKKKLLIFIFWQWQYSDRIVWGQYRKCCSISFIVHEISFRDVSLVPSVTKSGIHRHLQAEKYCYVTFLHWNIKIVHIVEHFNTWTYNVWGKKTKIDSINWMKRDLVQVWVDMSFQ